MNFEITENPSLEANELLALYESVGWTNYTARPEMLRRAYGNSLCILGAYAGGRLIGVLRAVGDGHSIVFVQDLLVTPEYQRRGVGTALMKAAMERYASVYQFELLTDESEKTVLFYRSLGLTDAAALGCKAFLRIKNAE